MAERGVPLTLLYLVSTIFVLFATAYGALDLEPAPAMLFFFWFGPSLAVAAWLAADSRRTHVGAVYDAGWLFYIGWPLVVPWYTVRTRGRAGWWLAIQLYAMALAAPLGFAWGEILRLLVRLWVKSAA